MPLPDFFVKCLVRVCPRSPSGRSLTHSFPLGLVKAINTAVDLIVAHFGTSRDPGVKVCLAFNIMCDMERMEKDCLSILVQSKTTGYPMKVVVPRTNQRQWYAMQQIVNL